MVMYSDDVQVVESSLVSPSQGTPRGQLWLSPLDLLLVNRGHTPTVYFYRPAAAAGDFFDVARLKESMARALVDFYPLAGRLGVDADGRFVIDCNAEGALFTVARAGDDVFQVLRAVAGGQTDVRAVRAVRRRSWPCFR